MLRWIRTVLSRSSKPDSPDRNASRARESGGTARVLSPLELFRGGWLEEAQSAADAALATDVQDVESSVVRALCMLEKGRHQEALLLMRRTVQRAPTHPQAHLGLGRALQITGQHQGAADAFKRAAALDPTDGEPIMELARQALGSGRPQALEQLEQALRLSPDLGMAHLLLGNVHLGHGRMRDAERHLRAAVTAMPAHAGALCNLGGLLKDTGNIVEATEVLERAVALPIKLAPATFNLAMLRIDQQRWSEAVELLRHSIAADRKQPDAYHWLATALMGLGDAGEARKAYQTAIRLDPKLARPRWGFAMAQLPAVPQTADEQRMAISAFRREVERLKHWFTRCSAPDKYQTVAAQQPYYLAYIPGNHSEVLTEYGRLCTTLMAEAANKEGVPLLRSTAGTKYRVGIVSAHVSNHSVWNAFVRGWIEHLDSNTFELEIFHVGPQRDEQTQWASSRVKRLHFALGNWSHWAKAIARGQFDVLIYPEVGMNSTTAQLASLRLAPVQLAAWGHPITTGLPTIDGFVSARAFEPMDAADHYTEQLIALPGIGCCYRPFDSVATPPDMAALGLRAGERLLLCPGTPFKYGPEEDALFVEIARRCSPCKLLFFRSRPVELAALLERRLRRAFDARHLSFDDHVRFVPHQTQSNFFGLLDQAIACLDTIEFSGFNTLMQAIERGAPIVAWEGKHMRGRFGSGILRELGVSEWIADTHESYADLVSKLVEDVTARSAFKEAIVARRPSLFGQQASIDALSKHLIDLVGAKRQGTSA